MNRLREGPDRARGDYNGAFLAVAGVSLVAAVMMQLVRRPSQTGQDSSSSHG